MFESFWDAKTARILSTTLIIAMILAFLYGARQTLTLFLFAVLFAYLVDPLVSYLEKPLRGRTQAIGAVYLLLIALLVGIGFVIGPKIADEGKSLATSLPSLIDRIGSGQLVFQIGQTHGWSQQRVAQIQSFFYAHRTDILNYAKSIGESLAEPAQHIWWLILIPILSLFFLKDGRDIADNLIGLARTPEEKSVVQGIVRDVNTMLGSYIRAQLLLCAFTAVAYTVVLSFMQVPYAFILGPIAGIFEFVPTVGPAIAAVGIFAIAALTSYPHLAWIVLFLTAWRLVQDYVNSPRVMGKSLEITPLVQLFAVLAGGEIGGVVGALISVPVVAALRILWRRMSKYQPAPEAPATFRTNRFRRLIMRP
jgi:predicted PurR-regulated permease PerM